MGITWLSKKKIDGTVSIYRSNLTFNTVSSSFLDSAYRLRIGVEGDSLIIEPLQKERVIRGDLDEDTLYEIKRKKSYSRVSDTGLISEIIALCPLDLSNEPLRKKTHWDEARHCLMVDLKGE